MTTLKGLIPLMILLVIWQLAGSDSSLSFPPPSSWIDSLRELADHGSLGPALRTTLVTFALSLVIATVIGAAVGMAIGASRRVDRALTPTLDFFRSLPPPAVVPVAALILGISLRMSVTVVVIAIVWPILLNTAGAMRDIPAVRIEMSRTLGLGRFERIIKVVIPSLLPAIMVGVRVAVSISLVVTLLVEIIGSSDGVGQLLAERQQSFDAAAVWGLLLLIGVLGFAINALIAAAEQRLLRNWPEAN
ncbi:MAG TPA: ABC transporter permease subunit [Solirubrobacterales bacterium]|nr:ABC transporter permease subunit [Solirubrobacterales bacterium]